MTPPADARLRVLVVEDDLSLCEVLTMHLEREGYEVAVAADGREGMQAIVTGEPDIVVSDWMMPHVDGLELCQSVKTGLGEGAPYFILLTAKGQLSDRLLALENGADDYLTKPCGMSELMARVRSGARIVQLARELRRTTAALEATEQELAGLQADRAAEAPAAEAPAAEAHAEPSGRRLLD